METSSTDASQAPRPELFLVGAGVCFPEHLTIQTIETLSACKRICTNLPAAAFAGLPEDIRIKCESLWPLYQDKRHRLANYQDVAQAVLDAAKGGFPVAWMTPGHPVVFDSVSQILLRAGRARGWRVSVLPAISSLDTILAEVGYDPAGGLLVHEATAVVRHQLRLDPGIATLLLQPSAFGSDLANISGDSHPDLSPLRDYLLRFYAADQECGFIRSSSRITDEPRILWTKLRDLATITFDALANSTLLIPSATVGKLSEMRGLSAQQSRQGKDGKSISQRAASRRRRTKLRSK